jgi:hypothetical protein
VIVLKILSAATQNLVKPDAWDLCATGVMEHKVLNQHSCNNTQIRRMLSHSEHVVSVQRVMK